MGQSEDRLGLARRVSVEDIRLPLGGVPQETVEDVDRLPNPTGDKITEPGEVMAGDRLVVDTAVLALADVAFAQEMVLPPLHRGAGGDGGLTVPAEVRPIEAYLLIRLVPK